MGLSEGCARKFAMNVSFIVPEFFAKGRIFAEHDLVANRDDCLRPFIALKAELQLRGIYLGTHDEMAIETADAVLCLNMPKAHHTVWQQVSSRDIPVHVIALESEFIHTDNAKLELLAQCTTVFTYRDDLIDGKKFLPIRFAQRLRDPLQQGWKDRRFAC